MTEIQVRAPDGSTQYWNVEEMKWQNLYYELKDLGVTSVQPDVNLFFPATVQA